MLKNNFSVTWMLKNLQSCFFLNRRDIEMERLGPSPAKRRASGGAFGRYVI